MSGDAPAVEAAVDFDFRGGKASFSLVLASGWRWSSLEATAKYSAP